MYLNNQEIISQIFKAKLNFVKQSNIKIKILNFYYNLKNLNDNNRICIGKWTKIIIFPSKY